MMRKQVGDNPESYVVLLAFDHSQRQASLETQTGAEENTLNNGKQKRDEGKK